METERWEGSGSTAQVNDTKPYKIEALAKYEKQNTNRPDVLSSVVPGGTIRPETFSPNQRELHQSDLLETQNHENHLRRVVFMLALIFLQF